MLAVAFLFRGSRTRMGRRGNSGPVHYGVQSFAEISTPTIGGHL